MDTETIGSQIEVSGILPGQNVNRWKAEPGGAIGEDSFCHCSDACRNFSSGNC